MVRGLRAVALLVPLLALCAGCTQSPPSAPSAAAPSSHAVTSAGPVFRSNAEALAAAKATYKQYLKLGDVVLNSNLKTDDSLAPFVTSDELREQNEELKQILKLHYTSRGYSKLGNILLQSADLQTGRTVAYTCVDFSGIKVVDSEGRDKSLKGSLQRQTGLTTFVWNGFRLLVADEGDWRGRSIC